uniref:Uncharacterized protein n=1 Tax=Steinernema glaseri TaxID=37863 RepID=A0A1I8AJQ0_9BILA
MRSSNGRSFPLSNEAAAECGGLGHSILGRASCERCECHTSVARCERGGLFNLDVSLVNSLPGARTLREPIERPSSTLINNYLTPLWPPPQLATADRPPRRTAMEPDINALAMRIRANAFIGLDKNYEFRASVLIHRCWNFVHATYRAKAKLSLAPSDEECAFEFLLRVAIAYYHAHVHSKYGFSLSSSAEIPKFIELCLKDYLLQLNDMGDCNQPAKTVARKFTKEVVLDEMRKAWKAILSRHPEEHANFEERIAAEESKATMTLAPVPGTPFRTEKIEEYAESLFEDCVNSAIANAACEQVTLAIILAETMNDVEFDAIYESFQRASRNFGTTAFSRLWEIARSGTVRVMKRLKGRCAESCGSSPININSRRERLNPRLGVGLSLRSSTCISKQLSYNTIALHQGQIVPETPRKPAKKCENCFKLKFLSTLSGFPGTDFFARSGNTFKRPSSILNPTPFKEFNAYFTAASFAQQREEPIRLPPPPPSSSTVFVPSIPLLILVSLITSSVQFEIPIPQPRSTQPHRLPPLAALQAPLTRHLISAALSSPRHSSASHFLIKSSPVPLPLFSAPTTPRSLLLMSCLCPGPYSEAVPLGTCQNVCSDGRNQ